MSSVLPNLQHPSRHASTLPARLWPASPPAELGAIGRGKVFLPRLVTTSVREGKPATPLPADVSTRFGVRLRELRCAHKLTQADMARKFGIDRSFISDVERGRKSISLVMIDVLALGLGITIAELLADI